LECGATLTGPVCVNCAQRADALYVDFLSYDDLASSGEDWGWH
jgi:acetamidase/formamidase